MAAARVFFPRHDEEHDAVRMGECAGSLSQVASAFVPLCVDMIQLNYKTCADILPWYRKITFVDFLVIALATGILTALKPLVVEVTQEILARYCNNADRNLMRASDMMYECATRVLIVSWTFYDILLAPKCSYLKAPTHVLRGIWEAGASGADMSPERRLLLLFTISRYSSALIDVLFVAEKRKDSISLVIHHVVAVFMMTAAYTTFPEVGLSVFFLHEACDPSLELAKILHYLQRRGEDKYTAEQVQRSLLHRLHHQVVHSPHLSVSCEGVVSSNSCRQELLCLWFIRSDRSSQQFSFHAQRRLVLYDHQGSRQSLCLQPPDR